MDGTDEDRMTVGFESASVKELDTILLKALVKGIFWPFYPESDSRDKSPKCVSGRDLCSLSQDTSRSLYKPGSKSYRIVRNASDFLGIPPWFLFHGEQNAVLHKQFQRTVSEAPVVSHYRIADAFRALKDAVRHHRLSADARNRLWRQIEVLESEFPNEAEDGYLDLFDLLNKSMKATVECRWSRRVLYSFDPDYPAGIFRFVRIPKSIKSPDPWLSCWFAPDPTFFMKQDASIFSHLKHIANRITDIIRTEYKNCEYVDCHVADEDKDIRYLFLWHSHRNLKEEIHKKELRDALAPLLPHAVLDFRNVSLDAWLTAETDFDFIGEYRDFIFLLAEGKEVNPKHDHSRNKDVDEQEPGEFRPYLRRTNTLPYLAGQHYLQPGDRLILRDHASTGSLDPDDSRRFATIAFSNGRPVVRWDHDGRTYSISRLTRDILDEFGEFSPKTRIDGNLFWHKEGDDRCLFQVAEEYIKSRDSDPTNDGA